MGKPVTLDSDDVEVLLNAAVSTAKIDSLLQASKQDPAMSRLQAKGQIEQALDRVNRARADAIRNPGDRHPDFGIIPNNADDKERVRMLYHARAGSVLTRNPGQYQELRGRGLVVAGAIKTVIAWGDGTQDIEVCTDQAMRLTEFGRKAYEDMKP